MIEKLRSLLARLATLGLLVLSVGSLGVAALFVLSNRLAESSTWGGAAVFGMLLGMGLITGYCALRLAAGARLRVAFEIGALFVALLGAELAIRIIAPDPPTTQHGRKYDADHLGLPFDLRTKSEVVAQLRARGVDAQPGISREWPRNPRVRQQLPDGMFPLSHASNVTVVECNESGSYVTWHADEYGFRNPPGLIASGHVEVAAVGASFTLGHCVPDGESVVSRLRKTYPQIANFGIAGSGTLSMLATFREYVEPLKPRTVLWIMHPWTVDTREEAGDPVLKRYFDPAFSQHLMEHQAEVDRVMRAIAIPVQYEADTKFRQAVEDAAAGRFVGILSLSALRQRLALPALLAKPPPPVDLGPWEEAVDLARHATEGWGGRFVVVIMPLYAEVVEHTLADSIRHDKLAGALRARGVEVIDTVPVFLASRDPNSLYVMRRNNHPTPEGHRMLADFIQSELSAPGRPEAMLAHGGGHP